MYPLLNYITHLQTNQGVSLVYHPQLVAVYHQPVGLDIIKPQKDARWRVMRYSPNGADDIHDCVVMIYQACGLDKQKRTFGRQKFLFVGYKL